MLRSLDIRELVIIDALSIEFQPGLNVLTGETGAGKSILLDALGLVLGWRGRADLVRVGAKQGEVVAEFELAGDHPVWAVLDDAGIADQEELILRRTVNVDGRKTGYINDRRVSGDTLRRVSDLLVELHGQQDDKGLLNTRAHRDMLDSFGKLDGQVASCREKWRALSKSQSELEAARATLNTLKEEEEFLRHAVGELDQLQPQPGEDAALDAKRRLMQAGSRTREDIVRALEALGVEGAEGRMLDASRWIDAAGAQVEGLLDEAAAALNRALNELADAQMGIGQAIDAMSFDPAELEATEERLFALRALARKHGVAPDALGELAQDLRMRLEALDGGAQDLSTREAALETAQAAFDRDADVLGQARASAAEKLDLAMASELTPLKMERAVFSTEISEADPGPGGRDAVQFTVATNPGAPKGALNKIASGGELSRFLLALKVCLARGGSNPALIFDEIDRGVGGATADAVGRRLSNLAEGSQILVVTHSPQVAAYAANHWRVEKHVTKSETLSRVLELDASERIDELARMLSGDQVTDAARDAAKALIGEALVS